MDSSIALLVDFLNAKALSKEAIDLGACLGRYAFDVTSEITFGRSLRLIQSASDAGGIMADIRLKVKLGAALAQIPVLSGFVQWNPLILALFDNHPIVKLANACMKERDGRSDHSLALMPTFVDMCYQAKTRDPHTFTDRIICMYCVENMMVGSETTAISLQALFYFLIQDPLTLQCLLSEQALAPEHDALKPCPYLEACIDEAFRMHPAVGLNLERSVPVGGTMLEGYFVPEGTIVGTNPWVVARDESVVGPDADQFKPERWLSADPQYRIASRKTDFVFGAGPNSCIGKNLVKIQMAKLVPHIFGLFKFRFANENQQREIEGGWLVRQKGYSVTVEKR